MNKDRLPNDLYNNYVVQQFVNNFSALLLCQFLHCWKFFGKFWKMNATLWILNVSNKITIARLESIFFKNVKKIEKIHVDYEKLISWLFIEQLFFYELVNNFPALLLCQINVLDFFDMGSFFQIFVIGIWHEPCDLGGQK